MGRELTHRVERIHRERQKRRKGYLKESRRSALAGAKIIGSLGLGVSKRGNVTRSRELETMRIRVRKWYVGIAFRKEDKAKIPGDCKEAEKLSKERKTPKKLVRSEAHIITAVRMHEHVRRGYADEERDILSVLEGKRGQKGLDRLNIDMAGGKHPEMIDEVIAALKLVDKELGRKHVAIKRIVARAKVKKAITMLEQAKEMDGGRKAIQIGAACAVLTALRNRLEARVKEIKGLSHHNKMKEEALRAERDRWLAKQISAFIDEIDTLPEQIRLGAEKLGVLSKIRSMVRGKKPKQEILDYITENSSLFRVAGRNAKDAERKVRLLEMGRNVWGKPDYQIGHYRWLYRYVRAEEKQKALEKIEFLELFVNANKPAFVAEELSKEPDPYLSGVIGSLGRAVYHLKKTDLQSAKRSFERARYAIDRIVVLHSS